MEKLGKKAKIIKSVMLQMEETGFTKEEAGAFPEALKQWIQENNERFENEKPFVIHEHYKELLII